MFAAASLQSTFLDVPTLSFVAVCITVLLGLFLIFAWLQQLDARALAWWGAAYLLGAASMVMWSAPAPLFAFPQLLPAALTYVACGILWNGVRLFHGRPLLPAGIFGGAIVWLILNQFSALAAGSIAHIALGALIVACYTFVIAFEFWRERRKSLYSRTAAIMVTCLHVGIFLTPLTLQVLSPTVFSADWLTVFSLETIFYAVGAAFIMLLIVKDHHVHVYRKQATTDHLTGLCNRGAFLEAAIELQARQGKRGEPVTLLMFDLDHFKSINDRFGHGVGDSVLRVFAQSVRKSMRTSDIIGRLGGEEFAAMVSEPMEMVPRIAERIRAGFEAAGAQVGVHAIGATVSIGAATSYEATADIDALLLRADGALYRAKHDGRNRFQAADEELASAQARLIAAARREQWSKRGGILQRKLAGRRTEHAGLAVVGEAATAPLLYPR
jgi:diguanylate cyclase (GGDEF)-like protein